jgi:glycosyltransferase involved in cell wall biosynthesis
MTIIVPAHDESSVIERCLRPWVELSRAGEVEVIVAANGCTDDTAARAAAVDPRVRVIETPVGSKPHALNLGDRAAVGFPRVYLDADVILPRDSLARIVEHLRAGRCLAAAPRVRWDLEGASSAVRAFYDIDGRLPSSREGIGGSGVYVLSEEGRKRFGEFPNITADDAFVRRHFAPHERAVLEGAYSIVTPPKRLKGVVAIKTRSHYGNYEIDALYPHLRGNRGASNRPVLLRLMLNPARWPALAVYGYVKVVAKTKAYWRWRMKRNVGWERDDTSRQAKLPAQVEGA